MEYYSSVKKKQIMKLVGKGMDLEYIKLSEPTPEKKKHIFLPHLLSLLADPHMWITAQNNYRNHNKGTSSGGGGGGGRNSKIQEIS
jgi:hypothetical protein